MLRRTLNQGLVRVNKSHRITGFDRSMFSKNRFNGMIPHISFSYTRMSLIPGRETESFIRKYAREFGDAETEEKLYTDFIHNTTHSHNNTSIEIGKLMDKYEIEPHELLYAIYNIMYANLVCGISNNFLLTLEHDHHEITLTMNDAKHILKEKHNLVEYLYGKPIKIFFRRNKGENQYILMKKNNDRLQVGNDKLYRAIMWLMMYKLKNQHPVSPKF
jgi:hypothetical protein